MAVAKRTLLRKLAIKAGLLKPSPKSFTLQTADLEEMLEETFPGIDEMEEDELEALYADTEGADPADDDDDDEPKKKSKKGKGKKGKAKGKKGKKDEPEDEDEDAPKKKKGKGRGKKGKSKKDEPEDEPKTKKGKGRAKAKKGKKSKKDEPEESTETSDVDLGALTKSLDSIASDIAKSQDSAVAALELVAGVAEKVDMISAAIVYNYNETLYDEDGELYDDCEPIDSIDEGPWMDEDDD